MVVSSEIIACRIQVGTLRWCCYCRHIRLRAPYGLTWLYTYGSIESFTGLHMDPVPCPHRRRKGPARESAMFFISYGTRTGPARLPKGTLTDTWGNWHILILQKSDTGVICGRTGLLRSPHGLFMGCFRPLYPYGSRKLIMHAIELYGPRTGRQNSYGAARVPCCSPEWTYDFC